MDRRSSEKWLYGKWHYSENDSGWSGSGIFPGLQKIP
jgi:hypothetical protein